MSVRAAVCQFPVSLDVEANVAHIVDLIDQAADAEAAIAVFAECALSGYPYPVEDGVKALDAVRLESGLGSVRRASRERGIWTVTGSTHVCENGDRFNSAYVVDSNGALAARYDKRILFAHERRFYSPGQKPVTFEIDGLLFGVLICYEMQFAEFYREYKALGVECVVHPKYSLPEYDVDPLEDVVEADSFPPSVHAVYNRMTILSPNDSSVGGSRVFYPDGREEQLASGSTTLRIVEVAKSEGPRRQIDIDRDSLLGYYREAE